MIQQKAMIANGNMNKVLNGDREVHNWYRFVLSYPPHVVRDYLDQFGINSSHTVLDPFCGTGTTIVECQKLGIKSIGVEAHPMTFFASGVKTDWSPEPDALQIHARKIADAVKEALRADGIEENNLFQDQVNLTELTLRTLTPEQEKLILKDSISPLPLHKVLVLIEHIEQLKDERFYNHERLALAQALVSSIGNLRFGPEVGIGVIKKDADVVNSWLTAVSNIVSDLRTLPVTTAKSIVYHADSR